MFSFIFNLKYKTTHSVIDAKTFQCIERKDIVLDSTTAWVDKEQAKVWIGDPSAELEAIRFHDARKMHHVITVGDGWRLVKTFTRKEVDVLKGTTYEIPAVHISNGKEDRYIFGYEDDVVITDKSNYHRG